MFHRCSTTPHPCSPVRPVVLLTVSSGCSDWGALIDWELGCSWSGTVPDDGCGLEANGSKFVRLPDPLQREGDYQRSAAVMLCPPIKACCSVRAR